MNIFYELDINFYNKETIIKWQVVSILIIPKHCMTGKNPYKEKFL